LWNDGRSRRECAGRLPLLHVEAEARTDRLREVIVL
jgi:hypothetical protein